MILFKTVRFKNFGSFGNNFTEIDLDKASTTLICGKNGSGKSFAFLDSITYGLFGKPFRKINIPQISNSINNKQCIVEIEFSKGIDNYIVKRGINPKLFEIYKNGILLNQDSRSLDYQTILEDSILKMNFKTFTQVVILGSSSFIPFMQLTTNDRRGIIENILDIDVFSTMNMILKGKIVQLKEVNRVLLSKIELQQNKISLQSNYVRTLLNKSNDDSFLLDKEIKDLEDLILSVKIEFDGIKKEITDLKTNIKGKDGLKEKLDRIKYIESKLSSQLNTLSKDIIFFTENDTCSMCKQQIDGEFKTQELTTRIDKKTEVSSALDQLRFKNTETASVLESMYKCIDDITTLQILMGKKEEAVENHRNQLEKLNNKKNQKDKEDNDITIEEVKLQEFKTEKENIEKDRQLLCSDVVYNETVFDLLRDNGVKSKIIKYYLPHINAYINKFLTSMDFFAQFYLDENFNEEIKSRNRDTFSYENFSEGEKMRIDLSLVLAWREIARAKNSVNCNLLILDEVFDSSLDSVGTDELMKLINTIGNKSNIFIISHKSDQLSDKFQNIITFEKKNNFSKMSKSSTNIFS